MAIFVGKPDTKVKIDFPNSKLQGTFIEIIWNIQENGVKNEEKLTRNTLARHSNIASDLGLAVNPMEYEQLKLENR